MLNALRALPLGLLVVSAAANARDMSAYSYVSPPSTPFLRQAGLDSKALEALALEGLKTRSIEPIQDNRVFQGSEDSLRVDIRRNGRRLVIALSVNQGLSVHNTLQRWTASRTLLVDPANIPKSLRSRIVAAISDLLDGLKAGYGSPAYREGRMLED